MKNDLSASENAPRATPRKSRAPRAVAHEVVSDTRTVWVNSGKTGHCLGRFSRWGIDIHAEYDASAAEVRECIQCTHVEPTLSGWQQFLAGMWHHHGVTVGDDHKPRWVQP